MTQAAFVPAPASSLHAARPIVLAVALGALTQLAFRGAALGASFSVFVALLVGAVLAHAHLERVRIGPRALVVAALAVASGAALTLRASTWSAAFGVPVASALVALLPVVVRGGDAGWATATARALRAPLHAPRASAELAREAAPLFGESGRRTLGRLVLGLAVGGPIALGFIVLLAFDDRFTGVLHEVMERASNGTSIVVWGSLSGVALLVGYRALATKPDEAPATTRRERPYRQPTDADAPGPDGDASTGLVAPLTWSAVVAPTAGVFLLYAAVSAPTWFAGRRAIESTSETYATYLHAGFVQLLLAATLSVGMILVGHFLLRPWAGASGGVRASGPVPGGVRLAVVEIALLAGTALALVSCAQRLAIYVEAYGATYERLAVGVACAFVLFVVVLTAWKSARRGFRGWAGALLAGAAVFGTACALFDADGTIARINLARGEHGKFVDDEYLAGLSCDARPALASPALDAEERARLDEAWAPPPRGDVRSLRGVLACR